MNAGQAFDRTSERWSGEAAENENERAFPDMLVKARPRHPVQGRQEHIGRLVPDGEIALPPLIVAEHPPYISGTDSDDSDRTQDKDDQNYR
jgi:hypothetical protein